MSPAPDAADLLATIELARSVLVSNWDGASTRPAPRLYPHQWSWDSAFIAIGTASWRPEESMAELRSLFDAQWANGMVPHIVFADDERDYFPSPSVWGSRSAPLAPRHVATSGMCQPPVHATAVRLMAERVDDARRFVADLYEPLAAWHDYLVRERMVSDGLVEIWHPWESGMDNSPVWDGPMAAMTPAPEFIPAYRRSDTTVADPADRPTDDEYDRYVYIVGRLRAEQYAPTDPTTLPFRVHDVLFNAALVRAERDLAALAALVGADGSVHVERSAELGRRIGSRLWSESLGIHVNRDAITGDAIERPIAGAFGALLARPSADVVARMTDTLERSFLVPIGERGGVLLPTVPIDDPEFEPTRYWRGPAWINVMWLVALGLDDVGRSDLAARLRRGIVDIVTVAGAGEYFDPVERRRHGSDRFSWTASLFLDSVERLGL